jgi:hypothetical protein
LVETSYYIGHFVVVSVPVFGLLDLARNFRDREAPTEAPLS